jgi:hypothetical protein
METYRGDLSLLEGGENAEELELAVDIGILLLLNNRTVDVGGHDGRDVLLH